MRILKEQAFAVQIDNQSRLYSHIYNHEQLLANQIRLIDGLSVLGIPIINTQQYTKGLGETMPELKARFKEFFYIEKASFSCCDDHEFMAKARSLHKNTAILFGIEAHVCVLQTAIDFKADGWNVVVIRDCISSRTHENKEMAINRMRQEGIIISTYESILFELLRYSDADNFKAISKIVK